MLGELEILHNDKKNAELDMEMPRDIKVRCGAMVSVKLRVHGGGPPFYYRTGREGALATRKEPNNVSRSRTT